MVPFFMSWWRDADGELTLVIFRLGKRCTPVIATGVKMGGWPSAQEGQTDGQKRVPPAYHLDG